MFEFFSCILAAFMLLFIAFPQHFWPGLSVKRKKVGPCYWGMYEDGGESPDETRIEIPTPARKCHPIAGSSQYASGKGTSLRK